MPYKLKRTPLADADYKNILRRTNRKWGKAQRAEYRGMLREAISTIERDPYAVGSKARNDPFQPRVTARSSRR